MKIHYERNTYIFLNYLMPTPIRSMVYSFKKIVDITLSMNLILVCLTIQYCIFWFSRSVIWYTFWNISKKESWKNLKNASKHN